MTNLDVFIQEFKKNIDNFSRLKSHSVFLCRQDGVVIYTNRNNDTNNSSIGALIGGLWQAGYSLTSFFHEQSEDIFRLSFDTSDSGVYILSLFLNQQQYFLGVLYKNELNPGLVKSQIRGLKNAISEISMTEDQSTERDKKETLFENITDDEIDEMFSTVGI